ncbi:HAD domain-containing protein [Aquabacterium sp. A7-Y]|uniref:HAD domain-containing protein n=1 Tax=Aquabacterium sp. A7-Y TaxID=1349605 RepID=UPI00223C9AC4|nr:HAD domain-containing protein [Aquabacterium sp. A7-Y]MCW7541019.1 HAD domain-containing protein [Aquabacterium sp. A7-Y]
MRVIFLNFDGCLHPCRLSYPAGTGGQAALLVPKASCGGTWFEWVPALNRLLAPYPDVCVVYSASRYRHTHREIANWLGALSTRYLGVTPAGPRYESIRSWLSEEGDVLSYRILDTAGGDLLRPSTHELIVCPPRTGVSAPAVQAELLEWLQPRGVLAPEQSSTRRRGSELLRSKSSLRLRKALS